MAQSTVFFIDAWFHGVHDVVERISDAVFISFSCIEVLLIDSEH